MPLNDVDITVGMRVLGDDGRPIGTVADVYPNIEAAEQGRDDAVEVVVLDSTPNYGPSSPAGYRAPGPASNEMTGQISSVEMPSYYDISPERSSVRTVTGTMWMRVASGGILGLGAKDLYIPFRDIRQVVPHDTVILGVPADDAGKSYGQKPDFLNLQA